MAEPLRVLLVEDVGSDALLIERELRRAGIACTVRRVETEDALLQALATSPPELILSDYRLPRLDGLGVLRIARARVPGVPLILVTGSTNEEVAVDCMKAGAADYVLKDRLMRLGPAVRSALEAQRAHAESTRLRAALEESARDWQGTFDSLEFPVLIADGEGAVARINRAGHALLGRPYADIVGQRILALSAAEPWPTGAALVARVAASGLPEEAQVRAELGGRTWDLGATLLEGAAPLRRVVLVGRDISPVIQLQESLRQSEVMSAMGSLVAGVAHEVRNPLFSISANVDAFEAGAERRPELQETMAVLRAEVARLSNLMRDLLDYGRPDRLDREVVAIEDVVAKVVQEAGPRAAATRVLLHTADSRERTPVLLDPARFQMVLGNLIANAIQHSPAGATVDVVVSRVTEGGRGLAECAVRDSGPGFLEEDRKRLFEPFFTRRQGGTGLGLSIVQRIVEQHGGTVIASNRPGGGACFAVRLPIATPPPLEAPV
jgi:signal transduction histidine kinase